MINLFSTSFILKERPLIFVSVVVGDFDHAFPVYLLRFTSNPLLLDEFSSPVSLKNECSSP